MQRFALSICSRCRLSLSRPVGQPQNWFSETQYIARRFRSSKSPNKFQKRPEKGFGGAFANGGYEKSVPRPHKKIKKKAVDGQATQVPIEEVPTHLALRAADWFKMPRMRRRLQAFGIPVEDIPILLRAFVDEIDAGLLTQPGIREKYTLERFSTGYTGTLNEHTDQALTNIFYSWASDPDNQPYLETIVPTSTLHGIIRLSSAADLSYPADMFPEARSIRRKFHMHVGPTNSGKTHKALRALAAAPSGVYAGPLRLLAHEVWDRLNKGQIVPLGMDPEPNAEPDSDTSFDTIGEEGSSRPTVRKQGNPKYARECNLLTGEESRVVSDNAGLMSCTVEMLTYQKLFDVAVVDEIQMIADSLRGGGWTHAVLGLHAKEIHLCGEATAIPIIEALLKETGDELVINRYERLTPLVVQEQSLEGDLTRVQKGDCLVAFSRSGIFALKRQVEELTNMRCAVAYGRLPPEIRSEQAALFNDPESGYDVMIGSDAIGMGLNLKIKRIIFEAVHKFNGVEEVRLSDSQIKQIAGRAGRYGLLGSDEPGGFVTTIHSPDLPILRKAVAAPIKPISNAYLSRPMGGVTDIFSSLPLDSSSLVLHDTYTYVSRMRWPFQFQTNPLTDQMCTFIDTRAGELTLEDKTLLMMAPVPWREADALDVIAQFLHQYRNHMRVHLVECLGEGPLNCLEEVEMSMGHGPPMSSQPTLSALEILHKLLIVYLWMQLRSPVAWCDHVEVNDLKERTERALDWCLQGISWGKQSRQLPDITTLRRKRQANSIVYLGKREIGERREAKWNANTDYNKRRVP